MKKLLKNKFVKISLKILAGVIVLLIVLFTIAVIYVHFNKDKIIAELRTQVSNSIRGDVQINDIDISLLSNFPNIAVRLNGVTIVDSQYRKPLLQADEISVAIGIFQLLKNNKEVAKITVNNAAFHLFTYASGYTNAYLLLKKDTATKPSSPVLIKKIDLENVNVLIEDAVKEKKYEFSVTSLQAAINARDSLWDITMNEKIFVNGLGFNVPKGSYLANQPVEAANWKLEFNTVSKDLVFSKSHTEINHQSYILSGKFHFKDSSFFQLHARTENIPLAQARQILTEKINRKLSLMDLKRPVNIQAEIHGPLAEPGDPYITATIQVQHNEITTTVTSFTNCSFTGVFNNHASDTLRPGDENTNIVFSAFSANWNGVYLKTDSILIQDLSDPKINFSFLSHSSLKDLDSTLALSTLSLTGGTADINLQYNGPLIADPSLLLKLNVKFILRDGSLLYEPRNISFRNCSGEIDILENTLAVNKLVCDVMNNHFEVNASGSNLNRIAVADSGKAFLTVNAASPFINLADFVTLFGEQKSYISRSKKRNGLAVTASKIDDILEKGTIQMNIQVGHVTNHHFNAENVNASLLFASNNWQVQHASLQQAGGLLVLKAGISEIRNNYHRAVADIKLTNVDVSKVFYAFNNFGMEVITEKNIRGTLNTTANLVMALNNNGGIIPGSMGGSVDFSIKNGALINYKPLQQIQDYILKDRDLTNLTFAELKDKLAIQNDIVHINRMEVASNAIRLFVEGDYGITGNTDISIQVPFSNFLNKHNGGDSPHNKGTNAKTGPSIYLSAKTGINGKVKIGLDLFGKKANSKNAVEN